MLRQIVGIQGCFDIQELLQSAAKSPQNVFVGQGAIEILTAAKTTPLAQLSAADVVVDGRFSVSGTALGNHGTAAVLTVEKSGKKFLGSIGFSGSTGAAGKQVLYRHPVTPADDPAVFSGGDDPVIHRLARCAFLAVVPFIVGEKPLAGTFFRREADVGVLFGKIMKSLCIGHAVHWILQDLAYRGGRKLFAGAGALPAALQPGSNF